MKKLIFFLFICIFLPGLNGMEIEERTRSSKNELKALDDPQLLAALHATLGATHPYPRKIGNKNILLSDAVKFSPEARELVNEITEPSCCNRLYGRGAHTLTTNQIERLKKHMPAGFMDDARVNKQTSWNPLCCGRIGGKSRVQICGWSPPCCEGSCDYVAPGWHPFSNDMDNTCIARELRWNKICKGEAVYGCSCASGWVSLIGSFFTCIGCCGKNCLEYVPKGKDLELIRIGSGFMGCGCGSAVILAALGLVYPCVCRKSEKYVFGGNDHDSSGDEEISLSFDFDASEQSLDS